jgi:hypothetical protein|tara:strand:+ start:67 stop:453 length:387 start_codon:yes stop_codon:yes gene_type:complete
MVGFFQWVFGRHESRPPDAERSIEAAWLPLWQAQLVLHELWEREIPAVQSEDFTSHLRFGAREPMARIFVMEPRLADALDVIESVIGEEPATLHGHDWPGWIRHRNASLDGGSPSIDRSPEAPPAGDQ